MKSSVEHEFMLSEVVGVEHRYQRSIRLDTDFGAVDSLRGFVVQESAKDALATTAKLISNGQCAFTWTGPYGVGKSSLALALASSLLINGEAKETADQLFGDILNQTFDGEPGGWLPILVTGRRGDPVADLREGIATAVAKAAGPAFTRRSKNTDPSGRDVIKRLTQEVSKRGPRGGVLVIIDEMGKYLEGAIDRSFDIHFFQDLAEAANRSNGRLVTVCILHQAFGRYAERFGSNIQDDWAKIQGRFVDIPIVTAIDEVIDLLGRAVRFEKPSVRNLMISKRIASCIASRRLGTPSDLADRLNACWPLHPVTAALLGPVSRRRFGQNQRSIFGFLSSAEPHGFQEFLAQTHCNSNSTFEPADLWDYLRTNYEPSIQASPDGHRWTMAAEAVERSRATESSLHEHLAKTVAVIDLFHNGSGIAAKPEVLETCGAGAKKGRIFETLDDLSNRSILVFRRHLNAYAVFAGSDFDIDAKIQTRLGSELELDISAIDQLAALRPILAKAHHFETGTPRWYATGLAEMTSAGIAPDNFVVPKDAAGRFVLVLPHPNIDDVEAQRIVCSVTGRDQEFPVVVGLPPNADEIIALGRELIAVQNVKSDSPELEGDAIGRREVDGRIRFLTSKIELAIRVAFTKAEWYIGGVRVKENRFSLSRAASNLANKTFSAAPQIHSELANRQKLSGNTKAAIRALLCAIAKDSETQRFGIKGYPQEVGIAETVLVATKLYVLDSGDRWTFKSPDTDQAEASGFGALWAFTDKMLGKSKIISVSDIYEEWVRPPYGLRWGVMPLLIVAYLMTRRNQLAVYVEGMFQPVVTDLVMDRLLQDPSDVAFRKISDTNIGRQALKVYAEAAEHLLGTRPEVQLLPVARALVEFIFKLPNWSRHARGALSEGAIRVRRAFLHAHDPHELFSRTLPIAVQKDARETPESVVKALRELNDAYPAMLNGLKAKMLEALKHRGEDFEPLRTRASAIKHGVGDDLRLNCFVAHLATFTGSSSEMEAICGLIAGQPVSKWRDLEPDRVAVQLWDFAYRFRRIELFGDSGDTPAQTVVMMMAGVGDAERSVVRRAQVSVSDKEKLQPLVEQINEQLRYAKLDQDRLLVVLADVAYNLLDNDGVDDVTLTVVKENDGAALA